MLMLKYCGLSVEKNDNFELNVIVSVTDTDACLLLRVLNAKMAERNNDLFGARCVEAALLRFLAVDVIYTFTESGIDIGMKFLLPESLMFVHNVYSVKIDAGVEDTEHISVALGNSLLLALMGYISAESASVKSKYERALYHITRDVIKKLYKDSVV